MSSTIDIQIVSTPNLTKIENFLNDSTYRETIEICGNFNTRLCIERRLRLPFLDPQTGVAQNHCSLFMDRRHRMPGFREGQIYTYPSARWRKSRRQYLTKIFRPFGALQTQQTTSTTSSALLSTTIPVQKRIDGPIIGDSVDSDFNGTTSFLEESSSLGAADTSDSKDSQNLKEELPKEWFYDEMDINEIDSLEEPKSPADDEYDYDPRYGNKKRKKRKPGRKAAMLHDHHHQPQHHHRQQHATGDGPRKGRPPGGGGGRGRGRRKNQNNTRPIIEPPSPTSIAEPPSFETAAAAVEHANDDSSSSDLRSYRKYL